MDEVHVNYLRSVLVEHQGHTDPAWVVIINRKSATSLLQLLEQSFLHNPLVSVISDNTAHFIVNFNDKTHAMHTAKGRAEFAAALNDRMANWIRAEVPTRVTSPPGPPPHNDHPWAAAQAVVYLANPRPAQATSIYCARCRVNPGDHRVADMCDKHWYCATCVDPSAVISRGGYRMAENPFHNVLGVADATHWTQGSRHCLGCHLGAPPRGQRT